MDSYWRLLRPKLGVLAAFAAIYLIWGSTYLAIKFAIVSVPPFTMTATRSFIAGAILYGWGRLRGEAPPRAAHWRSGAAVGALLFLGGHGGLGWAQQHVPSGVASLFIATIPLWMTLAEVMTERTATITARTMLGIAAGLAGIWLLVGPRALLDGEPVYPFGAAVLVLAALAWSVGSVLARRAPRPSSLTVTTGTYLLTGGAMLYVAGLVTGEALSFDPAAMSLRSFVALSYLIVFGSVIAFGAYSWLLRCASLAAVSTYAFVNPIIAVTLGWAIGGEPLTQRVFAATALVITGVILILIDRSTRGRAASSTSQSVSPARGGVVSATLNGEECA